MGYVLQSELSSSTSYKNSKPDDHSIYLKDCLTTEIDQRRFQITPSGILFKNIKDSSLLSEKIIITILLTKNIFSFHFLYPFQVYKIPN